MKKVLFLFLIIIIVQANVFGQKTQFLYKQVPRELKAKIANIRLNADVQRLATNAYDLTNALPSNYKKDGTIDYTAYIQKAISKYSNVIFPDFPILINENGLALRSNSNVLFRENSKIILKPNGLERYYILKIEDVSNVNIYYPHLIGDRTKHLGQRGEWGMGIGIMNSKNIKIVNPVVKNCWGDGIIIGGGKGPSHDIVIESPFLENNRRNGISITNGKTIRISNALVANSNGTLPMSGIDIEPDDNHNIVDDIEIINPITFNNAENGLLIALMRLPGAAEKSVNIKIVSHVDYHSQRGIFLGGYKEKYTNAKRIKGQISIINPRYHYNNHTFKTGRNNEYGPSVIIEGIKVFRDRNGDKFAIQSKEMEDINNLLKNISTFKVN